MTFKLQQDLLLLFQCIIDFGADVLRDCTKEKMKTNYLTDNFKIFLGKTKHHLFHQVPNQSLVCCACPITGCSIRKTGKMDRRIFDKFYSYDKTLPIPPGHQAANGKTIKQICICRFVENNKVLDDLDLSDLNCLLRNLHIMTSLKENLLKELMEVRGKVCHAVTTETFSQPEITNLWTTFMNSVCNLCPSDPKYLKRAIDLTKSTVLSDDIILELIKKVRQVITDCNEIKPVFIQYKEEFSVFENRQNEHNKRVETQLGRLESLLMGHFKAKQSNTKATVSVYDSEKSNINDVTDSGDRYIEFEANCPGLNENKASKRLATKTDVTSSKKLKIESTETHCILLKLSCRPEVFESEEILHSAIMSLVQQIGDAGDLDTSVDSKMDIKMTFTSPLTDDERYIIMSMLRTYGTINKGYTAKLADRNESIGDIDSNEMDYSDNIGHDEGFQLFTKEACSPTSKIMTLSDNSIESVKNEENIDLQINYGKPVSKQTKVLNFPSVTLNLEETGSNEACSPVRKLKKTNGNSYINVKKEAIENMSFNLESNNCKTEAKESKPTGLHPWRIKMEATETYEEELIVSIESIKCSWRIKGLPDRLQNLGDGEVILIDEGTKEWYLEWTLKCPDDWDILSVGNKLNKEMPLLDGYFTTDIVHNGFDHGIILQTRTMKNVFNSYSSAEIAFKEFLSKVFNICGLQTTEPLSLFLTTSVLTIIDHSVDGNDSIKEQTYKTSRVTSKDSIVCEHCKNLTNCYKCAEKLKLIMELTLSLKTNDIFLEKLAEDMKLTKEEMLEGLSKRMTSDKDATIEVLEPEKIASFSDKDVIQMEERYEECSTGETNKVLELDNSASKFDENLMEIEESSDESSVGDLYEGFVHRIQPARMKCTPRGTFHCKTCHESFVSAKEKRDHSRTHFICGICGKGFTTSSYLRKHCSTKHLQIKTHGKNHDEVQCYQCSVCMTMFTSISDLREHITDCKKY